MIEDMGTPIETGNAMDLALLLLRVLLGLLIAGHATQKLFGWFRGAGPLGTGALFDKYGVRPGTLMALFAGAAELAGAFLVMLGLIYPLGNAIVLSTMVVAVACNFANGIWAHLGASYEVAFVYGAVAVVLAYTGPGRWPLDTLIGIGPFDGYVWGIASVIVGVLGAEPILIRRPLTWASSGLAPLPKRSDPDPPKSSAGCGG
jgi:putative oxidoreductase